MAVPHRAIQAEGDPPCRDVREGPIVDDAGIPVFEVSSGARPITPEMVRETLEA